MTTTASDPNSLIFLSQNSPSLPVLMVLLKFMSSKTRSNNCFESSDLIFSGFFSVTTSDASVFKSKRTAVSTSWSSSMTNIEAFFKPMCNNKKFYFVLCNKTVPQVYFNIMAWQLIFYKKMTKIVLYQKRTVCVSETN